MDFRPSTYDASWNLPEGALRGNKDTDIAGECVFSSESQERLDLLTQAEALARQGTTLSGSTKMEQRLSASRPSSD